MAMFNIFNIFGNPIDFFADRLCRLYSFILFLVLAIALALEFHRPHILECWTPDQFSAQMSIYANEICKLSDRLYLPFDEFIPSVRPEPVYFSLNRLRYLPIVLSGQALLFLLPWLFWKLVSSGCCSLQGIVNDSAKMISSNDPKTGRTITSELMKLKYTAYSILFGFSYLLTKAMYWAVCLIQMAILAWFLDIDFFKYRYNQRVEEPYFQTTNNTGTLTNRTVFPRVVLCDFPIRQLGNVQRYTIQCSVPISIVIERYLYIIWAWLILLLVITTVSGFFYLMKSIVWLIAPKSYKQTLIKRKLADVAQMHSLQNSAYNKFGDLYLKPGMFLAFEILKENGSLHAVSQAVNHMWEEFLQASKIHDDAQPPEMFGQSTGSTPLVEVGTSSERNPGPYDAVQEQLKQA